MTSLKFEGSEGREGGEGRLLGFRSRGCVDPRVVCVRPCRACKYERLTYLSEPRATERLSTGEVFAAMTQLIKNDAPSFIRYGIAQITGGSADEDTENASLTIAARDT
jgi:hypothetical protein